MNETLYIVCYICFPVLEEGATQLCQTVLFNITLSILSEAQRSLEKKHLNAVFFFRVEVILEDSDFCFG